MNKPKRDSDGNLRLSKAQKDALRHPGVKGISKTIRGVVAEDELGEIGYRLAFEDLTDTERKKLERRWNKLKKEQADARRMPN